MKINVNLEFDSIEEMIDALGQRHEVAISAEVVEEAPKPSTKKKAAKKKAAAEVVEAPAEESKPDAVYTVEFDDVRNALSGLMNADGKGMEACREVLTAFGAEKVSGVPEGKWAEFIGQCEEMAAA